MLFTDAEGRLAYDHLGPEETERCLVVYGTIRGYPTRITRVPLGPDETTITLDAVGGRVVTGEHTPGGTWLVHDGCPVTKGYFQRWDPGGFPPLSPGRYDLCPAVTWQPDGRCVGGILPPSGTLHLDLRDAPGLR
jgi:hypothetical protein